MFLLGILSIILSYHISISFVNTFCYISYHIKRLLLNSNSTPFYLFKTYVAVFLILRRFLEGVIFMLMNIRILTSYFPSFVKTFPILLNFSSCLILTSSTSRSHFGPFFCRQPCVPSFSQLPLMTVFACFLNWSGVWLVFSKKVDINL